jgi:Uncharacterised protein family (UPF0158)
MPTSEPQATSAETGVANQRIEAFMLLADIVAQSASGRQLTASQARIQMKRRSYGGFSPEALGYAKFRDFLLQAAKRKPAPLEPAMFRETRARLQDESGNFIAIEPIAMGTQLEWRREFVASVADSRVRALLESALASEKPAKVFGAILREVPEEQARWRAIQRAHVRPFVERWRDSSPTAVPIRIDPLPRTTGPSSVDDGSPSQPPAHFHARSDQLDDLLSIVSTLVPWSRSQSQQQ